MNVRRAIPLDAPAIAAFMRREFLRRPEIRGDTELWTGAFALEQVERQYCVICLDGGKVVGVCLFVNAEIVLWGEPLRVDRVDIALASGGPLAQVRVLDGALQFAYKDRWLPEGIAALTGEVPLGSPGIGYWKLLGGSIHYKADSAWGIVAVASVLQNIRQRLREHNG